MFAFFILSASVPCQEIEGMNYPSIIPDNSIDIIGESGKEYNDFISSLRYIRRYSQKLQRVCNQMVANQPTLWSTCNSTGDLTIIIYSNSESKQWTYPALHLGESIAKSRNIKIKMVN